MQQPLAHKKIAELNSEIENLTAKLSLLADELEKAVEEEKKKCQRK